LHFDFRLPDAVTVSININLKSDLQLRGFILLWRCSHPCKYSNLFLLHPKAIWSHSSVRPSFR